VPSCCTIVCGHPPIWRSTSPPIRVAPASSAAQSRRRGRASALTRCRVTCMLSATSLVGAPSSRSAPATERRKCPPARARFPEIRASDGNRPPISLDATIRRQLHPRIRRRRAPSRRSCTWVRPSMLDRAVSDSATRASRAPSPSPMSDSEGMASAGTPCTYPPANEKTTQKFWAWIATERGYRDRDRAARRRDKRGGGNG
jgi:hypothetical protein